MRLLFTFLLLIAAAEVVYAQHFPVVKHSVAPNYPPAALAVRATGEVMVAVDLAKDGNVLNATAVDGHPLLRRSAEEAARKWQFSNNGNDSFLTLRFRFNVTRPSKKGGSRVMGYSLTISSPAPTIEQSINHSDVSHLSRQKN